MAISPDDTRRSSSDRPRAPPTKSIRLSVRGSVMPNNGSITLRARMVIGRRPIGSCGTSSGRIVSRYQRPARYMPNSCDERGRTGSSELANAKLPRSFARMTIEVFHDTIVVEDGHLPFGEDHRQKIVVRAFATSGGGDARGRGRTV